jgi:hypothetical protein
LPSARRPVPQDIGSANPAGRTKGSRNKLFEAYCCTLFKLVTEGGQAAPPKVMEEHPEECMWAVGRRVPTHFGLDEGKILDFASWFKDFGARNVATAGAAA